MLKKKKYPPSSLVKTTYVFKIFLILLEERIKVMTRRKRITGQYSKISWTCQAKFPFENSQIITDR